ADGRINVVAQGCRILDARAGVGADVNLELTGIYRGKKVFAQPGRENADGSHSDREKRDKKNAGMIDAEGKQADIGAAGALEAGFKRDLEKSHRIAAGASARGG